MRIKGIRYYKEYVIPFPGYSHDCNGNTFDLEPIIIYWKHDIRNQRWHRYYKNYWESSEEMCRVTFQNGAPDIKRLIPLSEGDVMLEVL